MNAEGLDWKLSSRGACDTAEISSEKRQSTKFTACVPASLQDGTGDPNRSTNGLCGSCYGLGFPLGCSFRVTWSDGRAGTGRRRRAFCVFGRSVANLQVVKMLVCFRPRYQEAAFYVLLSYAGFRTRHLVVHFRHRHPGSGGVLVLVASGSGSGSGRFSCLLGGGVCLSRWSMRGCKKGPGLNFNA